MSAARLLLLALIGLFYTLAAFEVDPGDTGDSFGDHFDTYLHSKIVRGPSVAAHAATDAVATLPTKTNLVLFFSFGQPYVHSWLAPLHAPAFVTPRRRRLLHAVWQI